MRAIALAAVLSLTAAAPALAADPAEGEWFNQGGSAKVRIAPCAGGKLCGTITWLRAPNENAKDVNNPDPALKTRSIRGMQMLWGFKSSAPGKWTGGKIYDPNSGKTYDSKFSVNPNGTLKLEGCILMVCQAQTWKRA